MGAGEGRGVTAPGTPGPEGNRGRGARRGAAAFLAGAWVPGTARKAGPSMLRAWGPGAGRDYASLPPCIYQRVPPYMYLTVGTRACVCAVYVWSACVRVWGRASARPGGSGGLVCLVTSYLSSPSVLQGALAPGRGGEQSRTLKLISSVWP